MANKHAKLFETLQIGTKILRNRIAVAPMTRVSGEEDGTVGRLMQKYYESFAEGGFGLIVTEGLYTDEHYSQGYYRQPGIATAKHSESWKSVVKSVQDKGAIFIAQLMHAGSLSQFNSYKDSSAGPSAVQPLGKQMPFYYGEGKYNVPVAMSQQDINDVISGFVQAAEFAQSAGFDGVEIHGANGYLLDQFLTNYSNQRSDCYGGDITARLRIYQEVIEAVRQAVGNDFIVGVRFSQKKVNDTDHVWSEGELAAEKAFGLMRECQVDYIHTTEPVLNDPAFEQGASLAALAKKYSGLPVFANGGVRKPDLALSVIENREADVITVGRTALANPDWPTAVRNDVPLKDFDYAILAPIANLESAKKYVELKE
jgi:2,4-dienoyl-CoA reductase-like NADH-dependent reductase (Old Yellow Enzyme family)